MKLTETAIGAAAKRATLEKVRLELTDDTLPGLRLRLTPAGTRTWVLACRDVEGRMRRFQIGRHPLIGVAEARQEARTLREKVRKDGADPVAEAKRKRGVAKDAKGGIGTLSAVVEAYGKQHGRNLKSWPECDRRIRSVFAAHLERALSTLRRTDLQMTADGWPAQQSAAAGVRYLRPVLKWAAERDLCTADLPLIKPPATVKRRDRILSSDELAALLPVLTASPKAYAAALRFMLLTLARKEEVSMARWRNVKLDAALWTIPQTKNGQPHVVPLSTQAVALLRDLVRGEPDQLVFSTAAGASTTADAGYLANWDRETKLIMEASGSTGWTRHDLRRTGATMLGEMGEFPDIIEAALNHVAIRSTLAATYNRSRYRLQVAAALQRLADALDDVATGRGEGAVVA